MIVLGLGFGDEGKGTITDWLARERGASAVVRFNGGPQAGHNVVTDDGRWHCFAQLSAGSFAGARTLLGPHMLVELEALAAELDAIAAKGVAPDVTIDPECTVITPMHKLVGQLTELRERRSSCGMGVGEAVRARERGLFVRAGDLTLAGLTRLRDECFAAAEPLVDSDEAQAVRTYFAERCHVPTLLDRYRAILGRVRVAAVTPPLDAIFEGAQGALLDRTRGFVPYVTQAITTHDHASSLAPEAERIGVLRAYMHRHGNGPLVTEGLALPDPFNQTNRWQGPFRTGWLDLVALRYAVSFSGRLDALAVTGIDRLRGLAEVRACTAYEDPKSGDVITDLRGVSTTTLLRCKPHTWRTYPGWSEPALPAAARAYVEAIGAALGVPVRIVSYGPRRHEKVALN